MKAQRRSTEAGAKECSGGGDWDAEGASQGGMGLCCTRTTPVSCSSRISMMEVIVKVCTVFGLSVPEDKTEIV